MNIENIKVITNLILAKVELLKLKADGFNWNCQIDSEVRRQIEETLKSIDNNIELLERESCLDSIMEAR